MSVIKKSNKLLKVFQIKFKVDFLKRDSANTLRGKGGV